MIKARLLKDGKTRRPTCATGSLPAVHQRGAYCPSLNQIRGLIVIDVDHFKDYNDCHGYLAGDVALRAVAQALASATRGQDLIACFGGEEFACLMIDADLASVAAVAERMRALVEALPPRTLGNDSQTITLSAGICAPVPRPGEVASDLLDEADAALYRAKHEGRNCVRRSGAEG